METRKGYDYMNSKSLYRSCAGRHLYGTENVIWTGFVPVSNTEKKNLGDYEQLLRAFFPCFHGQKKMFDFFSAKKLHKISLTIFFDFFWLRIG